MMRTSEDVIGAIPTGRSEWPTDEDCAAFVREVHQHQVNARYPELFEDEDVNATPAPRASFRRERLADGGSGLVVLTHRHAALSLPQRHSLSRFRLDQCLLCNWYDPALVLQRGVTHDPAFDALSDAAAHVVVGTREGTILSYFCLEPAQASAPSGATPLTQQDAASPSDGWTIADRSRPLFATERDLFGSAVFTTLPSLARTPISRVRELNYLLRNQIVPRSSRLGALAVVEAISAMAQLLLASASQLVAVVGHVDLEARRLTEELDVPILYAPEAQAATDAGDALWTRDVDLPGRFWPFVIAVADIVAYRAHFAWLDELLAQPASTAIRALLALRRRPRRGTPAAFVPASDATSDAATTWGTYPIAAPARPPARSEHRAGAAARRAATPAQ